MLKSKWLLVLVSLLISIMLVVAGCGGTDVGTNAKTDSNKETEEKVVIIKYAHSAAPVGNTSDEAVEEHHFPALKFKEYVEEASNGRIKVEIYPAGQMGGQQKTIQDVQQGILQMASVALNNVQPFSPVMGILDLPYIFTTREEYFKFVDEYWDEINEIMAQEADLYMAIWTDAGWRHLANSKRPVSKLEDLKGIKIRVPNNGVMIETFKAWNSEPVGISWDETYTAAQTKLVDGIESAYTAFWDFKYNEILPYGTEIHYKLLSMGVVTNSDWLHSLPDDLREIVIEGGKVATYAQRIHIAGALENARKLVTEDPGGMEFLKLEDEEKWMELAVAKWPEFYDEFVGEHMPLLDKTMKLLGRERPASK